MSDKLESLFIDALNESYKHCHSNGSPFNVLTINVVNRMLLLFDEELVLLLGVGDALGSIFDLIKCDN